MTKTNYQKVVRLDQSVIPIPNASIYRNIDNSFLKERTYLDRACADGISPAIPGIHPTSLVIGPTVLGAASTAIRHIYAAQANFEKRI